MLTHLGIKWRAYPLSGLPTILMGYAGRIGELAMYGDEEFAFKCWGCRHEFIEKIERMIAENKSLPRLRS